MQRIKWTFMVLVVGLGAFTVPSAAEDMRGEPQPTEWAVPDCERITGEQYYTYTTDEGLTFVPTRRLRQLTYGYGLAALDIPNNLLATVLLDCGSANCNLLLRSVDAGCRWDEIAQIPTSSGLRLVPATGGQAYAWSYGLSRIFWFDGEQLHERTAPQYLVGIAVNPDNAAHIRIGTAYGQMYESFDYGEQYSALGEPVSDGDSYAVAAFDPENWDNALYGGLHGSYRTTDAGETWQPIVSFEPEVDMVSNFIYSTGGQKRIWARAAMESLPVTEDCILVSEDGGEHFEPVVNESDSALDQFGIVRPVILHTTPIWAVHPLSSNVLYFIYGMYRDDYGTDFFRYDMLTDELSVTHTDGLDGIASIVFNPVDPGVMYVGLIQEIIPFPEPDAASSRSTGITMNVSPNPFNPSAEIRFSLPEAAQVRLKIYNLTGQNVATVIDGQMSAGEHTVRWDASRYASGLYLARLEAGSVVETKKLVLLK